MTANEKVELFNLNVGDIFLHKGIMYEIVLKGKWY